MGPQAASHRRGLARSAAGQRPGRATARMFSRSARRPYQTGTDLDLVQGVGHHGPKLPCAMNCSISDRERSRCPARLAARVLRLRLSARGSSAARPANRHPLGYQLPDA